MNRRLPLYIVLLMCAIAFWLSACNSTPTPAVPPTPPVITAAAPVVMMGDSITYNWSGENSAVAVSPTIYQLVPNVVDLGIPGNTTQAMFNRFGAVTELSPSVVVILGGTNDLLSGETPNVVYLQEMMDTANADNAKVIICTVPPSPALDASTLALFNQQIIDMANAYGATVADYYNAMLGQPDLFEPDGIHPNAAGYALMWPVLQAALAKVQP